MSIRNVLLLMFLFSCGRGPAGSAGKNGANGADGTNGANGKDGTDGKDGVNGIDGVNGTSCSVESIEEGALISCEDGSSAVITNGADGKIIKCKKHSRPHKCERDDD